MRHIFALLFCLICGIVFAESNCRQVWDGFQFTNEWICDETNNNSANEVKEQISESSTKHGFYMLTYF